MINIWQCSRHKLNKDGKHVPWHTLLGYAALTIYEQDRLNKSISVLRTLQCDLILISYTVVGKYNIVTIFRQVKNLLGWFSCIAFSKSRRKLRLSDSSTQTTF